MDAIMDFSSLQSLLPLARSLVEIVQQVIALTALVQLLCIFLLKNRKRLWKEMLLVGKSHGLSVVKCLDLKEDMSFVAKGCGIKLDYDSRVIKISSE